MLDLAATVALTHHERFNGSGYPRGLAGESISIEGRIVAIADVYDALTSDRVYRQAMSGDEALEIMLAERGRHFDPQLLDDFVEQVKAPYEAACAAATSVIEPGAAVGDPVFEAYLGALWLGDAATAQETIDDARAAGVSALALQANVIGPG